MFGAVARRARRARTRAGGEGGFTLVEMMVALAISFVVITSLVASLVTVQNHAAGSILRADSVAGASVGLREMDQDLRQAYELEFPTSTQNTGCTESSAGVQPCNVIDVLVRLSSSGYSGTDFEIRYDCSVASTTIVGDHACWRYLCSASATTASGSTCTASSTTLLSSRLVIDDLINGTSVNPVFSLCYPSTSGSACASGAARATSATVTIETASTGAQATSRGGDPATIELTDALYFPNLDFDQ